MGYSHNGNSILLSKILKMTQCPATTSSAILGVLLVAAFPGVGFGVAVAIAVILIDTGLEQVYYEMKMYSATDDEYQYIKRVIQFYESRGVDKIGSPIKGIQKKSLDAA